jgi:hypothetical protein
LANYVCHRNDPLTEGGGTAVLVWRVIVHHAVPVQGLQHLEATAIQAMLAEEVIQFLLPAADTVSISASQP